MPLYMSQVAYTPEHLSALTKEPQDRTEAISGLAQKFWLPTDQLLLQLW
jgi:hypothetical protein